MTSARRLELQELISRQTDLIAQFAKHDVALPDEIKAAMADCLDDLQVLDFYFQCREGEGD